MKILLLNLINERFSVDDVNARPTRGSEQAWAYLIYELSHVPGIELVDTVFLGESLPTEHYDVVIAYRKPDKFPKLNAKVKILWLQNPAKEDLLEECKKLIKYGVLDKIIVSTQYHRSTFNCDEYFQDKDEMFLFMDNGLPAAIFQSFQEEKYHKKKQLLYASAPHRGVDQFLDIWPKLHGLLPDYSLHIAGHLNLYSDSFKTANSRVYDRMEQAIEALAKMPAVTLHDNLDRAQYCQLMASSEALLYPCQTVEETSCITVHEAIVLGCVPIVSSAGALTEIVLDGVTGRVVKGQPKKYWVHPEDPDSANFRQKFVETVVETIESGEIVKLRQHNNPKVFSWKQQAENLADQLSELLNQYQERSILQRFRGFMAGITF